MSGAEDLPAAVWRRPPRVPRLATPARGGSACARWVGCTLGVLVAVGGLVMFAAALRANLAIWAEQPAASGVNARIFGPTPASWGRAHPPPNASTLRRDRIPKAAHPPRCWAYGTAAEKRAPAVTLMTLTVGLPKHYASCVRRARKAYASRHSLEYCEWASPLHVPRGNHSAGHAHALRAGAQGGVAVSYSRQKLIGVKALLRERSPRRALVWYLDADALVVEPSVSILARLKTNFIESETKAVMLTLDSPMYKGVQGGVFAIKRGKWSLEWLERVWGMWRVLGPKRQYSDRFAMQAWLAISAPEATTKTLMLRSRSLNAQTDEYRIGDFVYHFAGGLANEKGGGQKYAESKYVPGGLLSCMCELALRGEGAAAEERGGGVGYSTAASVRAVVGWVATGLAGVSFHVPLPRGLLRLGGETPRACDAGSEHHAAPPSGKGHRSDNLGSDGDKKNVSKGGGPHDGAVPASAWAG